MKNMSRLLFVVMAMPSLVAMEKRKEPERGQQEQGGGKRPRGFEFSEPRMIGFQDLPVDVQRIIFGLLQTGRGSTNAARLQTAAESLRKFMTLNRSFKTNYLDNEAINGYLIQQLAQRYTNGNLVEAALALRTAAGGRWLANQIQQMPAGVQRNEVIGRASVALYKAAADGELGIVSFLVRFLPAIVNNTLEGTTALIAAAQSGYIAVVERLLAVPGINVNVQNAQRVTALMLAADKGHTAVVERLLAVPGIGVNMRNAHGITALISAVHNGHTAIVERLLRVPGINVNLETAQEFTALMLAAEKGHTAIVERLLAMPTEPPIDVNLQNRSGETALTLAAEHGHAAIVKRLLAMPGINANVTDSEGFTALMIASYKGHTTTVEHLLTFPEIVDVNLENEEGFTALMIAAQEGHTAIVARLLAVPEINVNIRNDFEKTALQIAQTSDKPHKEEIIKLLKDHGAVE